MEVANSDIFPDRIKVNVVKQEVMKYKHRIEPEGSREGTNREAVKIRDKTGSDQYEWKFAAESNATILRDLHDKALLIFNVYYIPSKNAPNAEVEKEKEKYGNIIRQAFEGFVKKHFKGDLGCGCLEGRHLCQIVLEDDGFEKAKKLIQNVNYVCKRCVRVSGKKENLCEPRAIDD